MSVRGRFLSRLAAYGGPGPAAYGPLGLTFMLNLDLPLQVAGTFTGDLCDGLQALTPEQIAQQGDGDIKVVVIPVEGNDRTAVDLRATSGLTILFKKPDFTTFSRPALFDTNGADGRMYVTLDPADLDQAGYYQVQATFTVNAVAKSTVLGKFKVGENIVIEEP